MNILTSIIVTLIILQGIQWLCVLANLENNKYVSKKELLIDAIPGYFIIVCIKALWKSFEKFIMLD